jgi:hypothetical protein
MLEEMVFIDHLNQLKIVKTVLVGNKSKIWVVILVTVFNEYLRIIESVVEKELLRIIVKINVDLTKSIVNSRLNIVFDNSGLLTKKEEV